MATATAMTAATIVAVAKQEMSARLHDHPTFSDRFLSHMLTRNIRIEEDLIDQLFNSSEKRLARALLLLARYGEQERPQRVMPNLSQELLAEMVGTTRSRVNFFMNKFRKLGFIEYNGELRINTLAPDRRPARLRSRPGGLGSVSLGVVGILHGASGAAHGLDGFHLVEDGGETLRRSADFRDRGHARGLRRRAGFFGRQPDPFGRRSERFGLGAGALRRFAQCLRRLSLPLRLRRRGLRLGVVC